MGAFLLVHCKLASKQDGCHEMKPITLLKFVYFVKNLSIQNFTNTCKVFSVTPETKRSVV